MSESTTDRCTRVGAYSRRCMEVFTHVCVPLWSQCLTVSACLFLLRYTHTHARILRTEANLPTRVHNEAVSRSRGGFAGVGGEFTEALPRSLSRKPLLGRSGTLGLMQVRIFETTEGLLNWESCRRRVTEVACRMLVSLERGCSVRFRMGCGRLVSFPDGYREKILAEPVF